jgi:tight adherence protein C
MTGALVPVTAGLGMLLSLSGLGLLGYHWLTQHRRNRARRLLFRERPTRGSLPPNGIRGLLAQIGTRALPRDPQDRELDALLAQTGWRGQEGRALFQGLRLVLPLALMAGAALWLGMPGGSTLFGLKGLLVLFAGFALGYLAPRFILRYLARRRQARIRQEVPLLVHLLRVLFDAGLGFDQTLLTVTRENRRVIPHTADELKLVVRQVEAGAERSRALQEMADLLAVEELTDLVKLLRQIERYGGAIQEPLLRFSQSLADRRRMELRERVGKLSTAMTVIMVLFFLPALLVLLAGPAFLSLLEILGDQG